MAVLEKQRKVLDCLNLCVNGVLFGQINEDADQELYKYVMGFDTFKDFGSPSQITVTIAPGDDLN